jgi:hypothetical protein
MLLETLDTKKHDIIIFSENDYNVDRNFKIIYKGEGDSVAHRISFKDVCKNITGHSPKNLILYRLLTNIHSLQLKSSLFGVFIYLNGNTELFYTDPVYALKELEFFIQQYNPQDLRFIIQQVGLTTSGKIENFADFYELYHFDLTAEEAMATNDKEFVEAILASQAAISKKEKRSTGSQKKTENRMKIIEADNILKFDKQPYYKTDEDGNSNITGKKTGDSLKVVTEEAASEYKDINKIEVSGNLIEKAEEETQGNTKKTNPRFTTNDEIKFKTNSVLDIFKSSDSLKEYMEKKNRNNILKIK